jgi:peptidyl-prolyl cis-trans isomerase SurA
VPRRLGRAWALGLLGGLLLALAALAPTPADAQERRVLDEIAAVVSGEIVLRSEVDQLVAQVMRERQVPYSRELWMNTLNELIDQQVMAEVARRDTTITVGDQMLDDRLGMRIDQMAQQAGSEERLETVYGKSILEIKEDFRDEFRDQLLAQQLRQRKMQGVRITPSEVSDWFEQVPTDSLPRLPETVRLSHVVRYPKPSQDVRDRARRIIATLRDSIVHGGADFEAMARQFSDDAATAPDGGRLTGITLGDLVPEFAAVAARTEPGSVSQIFFNEARAGYHILRVNDRRGDVVDFNHILIQIDRDAIDPAATVDYLSAVRDSIVDMGAPFELMAKRHSEEGSTAQNGGRVVDPSTGVRDLILEYLDTTWRTTIRTLDEGQVSAPSEVKLLDGDRAYHIVRLERRLPPHRVNLDDDYELIEQYALQDKRGRVMDAWLDELREDVYVDIRIEPSDLTTARR